MHDVAEALRLLLHGDGLWVVACRGLGGAELPTCRHFLVVAKVDVELLRMRHSGGPDRGAPQRAPIRWCDPFAIARFCRRLAAAIAVVAQPAAEHRLGQTLRPGGDRAPLGLHRVVPLAQVGGALAGLGDPRNERQGAVLVAADRRQCRKYVWLCIQCRWAVIWTEGDLEVGQL